MRAISNAPLRASAARLVVGLAVATLAAALPVRAQQSRDRLPDRLQPATRAAIEHLADSLRSAGLPDDPVYSKAAEGVLKGADDARIRAAPAAARPDIPGAGVPH